jgi:hypothetical protein
MATNTFYNQTRQELKDCSIIFYFLVLLNNRKRQPLATIDDKMTKRRPNHNRLSLLKMAHATRTFWTQAEALEFIAERQKNEKYIDSVNMRNILKNTILYFIRVKFYIYSLSNHNQLENDDIKLPILICLFMNISKFYLFSL